MRSSVAIIALLGVGMSNADQASYYDAREAAHPTTLDTRKGRAAAESPEVPRRFGTNLDPVARVNKSLPKSGSVFDVAMPAAYTEFKRTLSRRHGLKLGVSYQSLYQRASDSLTGQETAWGGWFLLNAAWTAYQRGQDLQGKLVLALDGRHVIRPDINTSPGLLYTETGSLWPTDSAYLEWDVYPAVFFWEQRIVKDRFAFRLGQQAPLSVIDPTRFDEPRSAFTNAAVASPIQVIPAGPPGLGLAAKWWPLADSRLYISGIVTDINSPSGSIDWSGTFDEREFFSGAEIGYSWIRSKQDFDHIHLTVWHADEVSTAAWPTTAGVGVKISGNKQWQRIVGFGSYAYNTAEGGGFGTTNTRQAINAGVAYIKPLGITGETALSASWGQPIDPELRNQTSLEAYWKLLIISNLWLTPGLQYIFNPSFDTASDGFGIVQLKFSLFL